MPAMLKVKDPPSPTIAVWVIFKTVRVEATDDDDFNSDLALTSRECPYSITTRHLNTPLPHPPSPVWLSSPGSRTKNILIRSFAVLFTDLCSSVIALPAHTSHTWYGLWCTDEGHAQKRWRYKKREKKRMSVWQAAVARWSLACGIRVEYGGKLWMERPVFHLLDRENKSERERGGEERVRN